MIKSNTVSNIGTQKNQYLWILTMLSFTFPLSANWPILERHYIFWGISFLLMFMYSRIFFQSKNFLWLFFYLFIVYLNFFTGDEYFGSFKAVIERETFHLLFPVTMTFYILKYKDIRFFKYLYIVFGLFFIESALVSTYANYLLPGIMRMQANAESTQMNAAILEPFTKMGMSDYAMPHAVPVLIPALVYAIQSQPVKWKIFNSIVLVSSLALAYSSESFTALTFAVITLVISFLIRFMNEKNLRGYIFAFLLIIPFLVSKQVQLTTIDAIKSFIPEDNIAYTKISDIEYSIIYEEAEGKVENRTELYDQTLNSIAENLLWGTNQKVGEHAAILDRLAVLGLLGFIPYVAFIILQVKFPAKTLSQSKRFYYVGVFAGLLMMTVKNTSSWAMWFFLLTIMPCLIWYCETSVENVKKVIKKGNESVSIDI